MILTINSFFLKIKYRNKNTYAKFFVGGGDSALTRETKFVLNTLLAILASIRAPASDFARPTHERNEQDESQNDNENAVASVQTKVVYEIRQQKFGRGGHFGARNTTRTWLDCDRRGATQYVDERTLACLADRRVVRGTRRCAVLVVIGELQEHLLALLDRDVSLVARDELARKRDLRSAIRLGAADVEHVILAALRGVGFRLRQRVAKRIDQRRVAVGNPTKQSGGEGINEFNKTKNPIFKINHD
jgi:hypothetical protein